MGIDINPFAQQAIRNVKAGDTAAQRQREVHRRALVAGSQAVLQGLGGVINKAVQDRKDMFAAEASRDRMGKDVSAAVDAINGPDKAAEWMPPTGYDPGPLRQGHKDRLGEMDNADKAVSLPYGDVWNRRAFDDTYDEASLLGHDINVGRSLLEKQSPSDWDASGSAVGGPVPTENVLGELRGRSGLGGSLNTWGK